MKTALTIGLLLALSYGAIVALVFWFQHRLVYFPTRELVSTPAAVGLNYEDVSIEAPDGEVLHAWYLPAAIPTTRTVLFLHGNAGNISHRLQTLQIWQQLGLNVLAPDYRGYGRSTGQPTAEGTTIDAHAAWNYLVQQRGVAATNILIHGRSLGAAVALSIANDVTAAGVVIESTFTSLVDIGREKYPWLPIALIIRIHYPNRDNIARLLAPVLIAHSRDDQLIPFAHGNALFAAANDPKSLLEMHGGHNDGFVVSGASYREALARFARQHVTADSH